MTQEGDHAGPLQQDPDQGQIPSGRPPPSLASSQSQPVAPLELLRESDGDSQMKHCSLSLVHSNNRPDTGSTTDEAKIIPNIAPPQMFPSVTIMGKTAISMKPDGSCLFHALADQICRDSDQADNIREAIVNFMARNRDVFKAMLPLDDIHPGQGQEEDSLDWDEDSRLERYLILLTKKGVWGGEPEILAAAQHFGVAITVHQENGSFLKYNECSGGDTAHIRYSRQYNHYYSVKSNGQVLLDNLNATTNAAGSEYHWGDSNDTTSSRLLDFQPSTEHPSHSDLSGMTKDGYHLWPVAQSKRLVQMKSSGYSWKEIQAAIPHRTLGACQKHWCELKWMSEEARQAQWEVRRYRNNPYNSITNKLQNKEDAQPRKAPKRWTATEDELLLQLRDAGSTWSTILENLPGRTPSAVQKRWDAKRVRKPVPEYEGSCSSQKNCQVQAVDSTSAVRRAPKRLCVTLVEPSPSTPLPEVQSPRAEQEMSKAEVGTEMKPSATAFPQAGRRLMNTKTTLSHLDSAFAPAGKSTHGQHLTRRVPNTRWSQSDEQLLSKMKAAGHSWIEISKALPNNRSERAASSHWNEMRKVSGMSTMPHSQSYMC